MLEEVVLLKDELEAIRLADLDEKYQQEAADNMNVSRQTFGNIIRSAHQKIADALVNGKALKIKGGVVNGQCLSGPEGPGVVRNVRGTIFSGQVRARVGLVAVKATKIKDNAGGRINENLYSHTNTRWPGCTRA
jgi:predicted DNA-binding protein (UPF0251 family)